MNNEHDDVVVQHILENVDNTITAYKVHTAFPEAWRTLIRNALKQVEERLRSHYGASDVEVENGFEDADFYQGKWVSFTVRRTCWPHGVGIGLMTEQPGGRGLSIGLHTDEEVDPALEPVVDALNKGYKKRERQDFNNWPWYLWLKDPYDTWFKADAIREFSPQGDGKSIPAVETIFGKFFDIIEIVDLQLCEPEVRRVANTFR